MPRLEVIDGAYSRLIFPKEWIGEKLPVEPSTREEYESIDKSFIIELLDQEDDNRIYIIKDWPSYEYIFDNEASVNTYMFCHNYCSCRRKTDASILGANTDDRCEGERFIIRSILVNGFEYNLYSEMTMVGENQ